MNFYFAPMEGVTGYCFRTAYNAAFPGLDRFYTPFLSANDTFQFTHREERDVAPEHNLGMRVVPQIITNNAEMFVWAIREMAKLGYTEVNLNAGCPSGTVVAKGKGAGLLRDPDRLDEFLDQTFELLEKEGISTKISVKTRIGGWEPDEAGELIRVYNRYPLKDLIVHPRVQKQIYRGEVHLDVFRQFVEESKHHLVYNGDIVTVADYERITRMFPSIDSIMIGRGLLTNPALVRQIRGGDAATLEELKAFHEQLLGNYMTEMQSERNTLFKMKEYWNWLSQSFDGSERYMKEIRKADTLVRYRSAVRNLLANCTLKEV
ncbi:MAG: tRNA-dihydrouridine synthase family protein [Lachnospiraceae bacterium]|nr:tRNA-dihydrouridine synthase family protein [Lachnospiraceae bacterium]